VEREPAVSGEQDIISGSGIRRVARSKPGVPPIQTIFRLAR
jgi:hypothetical protein